MGFAAGGVDDEEPCELHRVVPAVVWPDGPHLAAGGRAAGPVHDLAGVRGPGCLRHRWPGRGGGAGGSWQPAGRSARRINGVPTAVRGMVVHAVAVGQASGYLVPLLYEVADHPDLPEAAWCERGGMA